MIKANELREKTKEVYKKKIKEEIKVIEETCLNCTPCQGHKRF